MNKLLGSSFTLAALVAVFCIGAQAAPAVGKPAPDFALADIHGQTHSLAEYKGKTVVLEWVNPDCPFVRKHYESGNMPGLQKAATGDGIVWLSINSGRPGAEGDYNDTQAGEWMKRVNSGATDYFRDQSGKVAKLYDARTTPHMFIIDGQGTLVYAGGIDSIRSANQDDIPKAVNYVREALADLKAGRSVRTPNTKPYGCSVNYAN
jgi:hypothetical protein